MKIWCQSASAIGKNPLWKDYEKVLDSHIHKVVRPGTEVEIHGVEIMSPTVDWLSYAEYLNTSQIIENGLWAAVHVVTIGN